MSSPNYGVFKRPFFAPPTKVDQWFVEVGRINGGNSACWLDAFGGVVFCRRRIQILYTRSIFTASFTFGSGHYKNLVVSIPAGLKRKKRASELEG